MLSRGLLRIMGGGACGIGGGSGCLLVTILVVIVSISVGVITRGEAVVVEKSHGGSVRQAGIPQECPTLIQERIEGGKDVVSKEVLRFMAYYFVSAEGGEGELCSGTLISDEWVLTAAHCFVNATQNLFSVVLGARMVGDKNGTEVDVEKVIWHPRYGGKDGDGRNDIALIKLKGKFKGLRDGGLRINGNKKVDEGDGRVVGYGDIGWLQTGSGLLLQVDVPVVGFDECKGLLGKARFRDKGLQKIVEKREKDLEKEANMCAGYTRGGCDSCTGDRGGPLLMVDGKGRFYQVGITSLGAGCGFENAPGIYTRVSTYADWIQKNTRNAATVRKGPLAKKYIIAAGVGGGLVLLILLYFGIGLVKKIQARKASSSDST